MHRWRWALSDSTARG
jgi:hypothetical protein